MAARILGGLALLALSAGPAWAETLGELLKGAWGPAFPRPTDMWGARRRSSPSYDTMKYRELLRRDFEARFGPGAPRRALAADVLRQIFRTHLD